MITLHTQLDEQDINEDEAIYTVGDNILNQFYYGNFSSSVTDMREYNISSNELIDYLEELSNEYDCKVDDLYHGHFSASFWVALGREGL